MNVKLDDRSFVRCQSTKLFQLLSHIHSAAQIIMRSSGGNTYSGISNANLLIGSCKSQLPRFWGQSEDPVSIIFFSSRTSRGSSCLAARIQFRFTETLLEILARVTFDTNTLSQLTTQLYPQDIYLCTLGSN